MIINGDMTKVVKFTLLIYFKNSKSAIIEWHKTSKSDCSSFVYWNFFCVLWTVTAQTHDNFSDFPEVRIS